MKRFLVAFAILLSLARPAPASNVGNLSAMGAPQGATFTLLTNPGNYFSVVGTEIVANPATPVGQYSVTIQATGGGLTVPIKKTFALNFTSTIPPPAPGVFNVGLNIAGAHDPFPHFAGSDQIAYFAAKGVNRFRYTISWSLPNFAFPYSQSPYPNLVGIQPVAGGDLDTISTKYDGNTSYVGKLNGSLAAAIANNVKLLLDVHMFGGAPCGLLGTPGCDPALLGDLWGKIANYYVNVRPDLLPGIYGFDLMNEWGDSVTFPHGYPSDIVFAANQSAITAIRANGYTGPIYVEGTAYTSSWSWTCADPTDCGGRNYNNDLLYQLVDPLNNLVSEAHMYPDPDDSGSSGVNSFCYAIALGVPGSAPAGLNLSPTIGNTRITRQWLPWTQTHGLRTHMGEFGTSNDTPWSGCALDFADWNVITDNVLTLAQANNMEVSLWASGNGGAGFTNGYPYSVDPFNANNTGAADFSNLGVQAPIWTVIDKFTGYSGPQPTAYTFFAPGLATPAPYLTVGVASQPFTIYYGGKITSPVTITPHANVAYNGAGAGGTFTPATVTLAAGNNAVATFTYTPAIEANILVTTTNNVGWTDPPSISTSSVSIDPYRTMAFNNITNEYGMFCRFTLYHGPVIRLQSAIDGTQRDWGCTVPNANGQLGFDRAAVAVWAGAQHDIQIVTWYNQIGGNDLTFGTSNYAMLDLQNSAGYPEVTVNSAALGNVPLSDYKANAFSNIQRMSQAAGTGMGPWRQDQFAGPVSAASSNGFSLCDTTNCAGTNTVLLWNVVANAYHEYADSWSNGVTNGFVVYKDAVSQNTGTFSISGGLNPQNAIPPSGNNPVATEFGYFKFFPGTQWRGALTSLEFMNLALTQANVTAINNYDNLYYSTPLPDTLPGLPPVVQNLPAAQTTVTTHFFPPFGMGPFGASNIGVNIVDGNAGTPTDSAVITITGDAGATITGAGITGSNPYTTASVSSSSLTSLLQLLQYQSSSSVGTAGTISLVINSSVGTSASASTTVTVGAVVAETPLAAPSGCTFTPPTYMKGVNISDAQISYPSNQFNYIYPQTYEPPYFASKGMTAIRLPLTAPRLQPWAYRPLDPAAFVRVQDGVVGRQDEQASIGNGTVGNQTNIVQIARTLNIACANNMYVLLEPHDFGNIHDNRIKADRHIGADAEGTAMFRDWWTRVATVFQNYPNVVFQEENEPSVQTAAQWQAAAALVTSDIAAITTARTVMVQGNGFDSCLGWTSNGNDTAWAGYTPPAGLNVVWECHQYLDSGASGTSPVCAGTGSSRLTTFTNWLISTGRKGFIGEMGWSSQASCMTSATTGDGPTFLAFLSANDSLYAGWTYWLGGSVAFEGGYIYTVVPTGYPSGPFTDKPQMQTLINNLP